MKLQGNDRPWGPKEKCFLERLITENDKNNYNRNRNQEVKRKK